jgi:hypothetical protein
VLPAALGVDATANHVPCLHRIRANYPHGASTQNVCLHETTAVRIERGYLVLADISGYTGIRHGFRLFTPVPGPLRCPLCRKVVAADAHANLARLRGRLGEAESSQDDLAA